MGVDYDGVGGIGIELTDEMVTKAIELDIFTEDEWDEDQYECIEKIGILFASAGNSYSGDDTFYLLVDGNNLSEILDNADKFISDIDDKFGMKIDLVDLLVISDVRVS